MIWENFILPPSTSFRGTKRIPLPGDKQKFAAWKEEGLYRAEIDGDVITN